MDHQRRFLIGGVLPAMILQSIGAFFYVIVLDQSPFSQGAYFLTKVGIILFLIVWIVQKPPLPKLRIAWMSKDALVGLFFGLLCAVSIGLIAWITQGFLQESVPGIHERLTQFPLLLNHFLSFVLIFSLAHALFEEWYWRYFVGCGLQIIFSPLAGSIVGSLAFTSHHVILLSQFFSWPITITYSLGIFLGGLLWSHLYRKTGNLLTPWIAHVMADLTIFVVLYLLIR